MVLRCLLPLLSAVCLVAGAPTYTREGAGPGVLLIHGYGGNKDVWKEVAAALAKDHTVVRVDLPGSGGSTGPALVDGAADFDAVAKDLAALVRQQNLAPCLIVGHSMGGPLATLTVLQDPGAFRGLVLVDSFLGTAQAEWFDPIIQGLGRDPKGTLGPFFARMTANDAQRNRVVEEALQVPVPVLQAYLKAFTKDFLKGRQAQLKVPVEALRASAENPDPAKREAEDATWGFKGIANLHHDYFPASKHWIMWDDFGGFLKVLRRFEGSLASPTP